MRIRSSVTGLLLFGLISSCAPRIPPVPPPETYKGPVGEQPVLQKGDYWVYQRANQTRAKTTALMSNIGFPLWIGKIWSYDVEMRRAGSPANTPLRNPARVECQATAFKPITVAAGTFDAFE